MEESTVTTKKRSPGRPARNANGDGLDMESRILLSAKELFRKHGYAAVSINDIVEAANITKPTLYYYYNDKEHLFAAVMVEMLRHGHELYNGMLKENLTLEEILNGLSEGYMRNCPTNMSAMMWDALGNLKGDYLDQVKASYVEYVLNPIRALLAERVQRGEIKTQHDPDLIAEMFLSLIDGLTLRYTAKFGRNFDCKNISTASIELFFKSLSC